MKFSFPFLILSLDRERRNFFNENILIATPLFYKAQKHERSLVYIFWEKQLTSNTGSSKKKVTSNRCYPISKIGNGPPMRWGWGGWLLMMIGDAMTPLTPPFDPRLTLSSMLFNIEFDVTVFDVPVFDVICLYPYFDLTALVHHLTKIITQFIILSVTVGGLKRRCEVAIIWKLYFRI